MPTRPNSHTPTRAHSRTPICLLVLAFSLALCALQAGVARHAADVSGETATRRFLWHWRSPDRRPEPPMREVAFRLAGAPAKGRAARLVIENQSEEVVRNFWIRRADQPSFYSATTLLDSVTAGLPTECDKALALWGLFPAYYRNHFPPTDTGAAIDPATVLAIFGAGQCNYAVDTLATLCQMAGLRTRQIGLEVDASDGSRMAHCVMEVLADGRWIYLDPDRAAAYRRADGEWASLEDLRAHPEVVEAAGHPQVAEALRRGLVVIQAEHPDPRRLARMQIDPSRYQKYRHMMRYDLLPGQRFVFRLDEHNGPHYTETPGAGPPPTYCPGSALVRFEGLTLGRLRSAALWVNVKEAPSAALATAPDVLMLTPIEPDQPAWLALPMVSPYLMTAASVRVEGLPLPAGSVQILLFRRAPTLPDEWMPLNRRAGPYERTLVDLFRAQPAFGFALRVRVPPGGLRLTRLQLRAHVQASLPALPVAWDGNDELRIYCEDATRFLAQPGKIFPGHSATFDNGVRIMCEPAE